MSGDLKAALDEIKASQFPAVEFDYKLRDEGRAIHIYHFEVIDSARSIGVGSTTLTDIEAVARYHDVESITVRMGLTNASSSHETTGESDEQESAQDRPDPTAQFLHENSYTTKPPTDGGVDASKSL